MPDAPKGWPWPSERCHATRTISPARASTRTGLSSVARTPSLACAGTASEAPTSASAVSRPTRRMCWLYASRVAWVPRLSHAALATAESGRSTMTRLDGRLRERGDLVALVLEQAGEDLLERSLAVSEPHRACGRHDVQLLITELLDRRERVSSRGETGEQGLELDVGGVVDLAVLPGWCCSPSSSCAAKNRAIRW